MSRSGELTAVDMVAVVVAGLAALALAVFPFVAASFARVFQDLGGDVPGFTRFVLVPWQPALALVSAGLIAFGLRARRALRARRVAITAAFAVAFFSFAACVVGLYLPIFAIAGSIKAD